jgi:hypothetical protein
MPLMTLPPIGMTADAVFTPGNLDFPPGNPITYRLDWAHPTYGHVHQNAGNIGNAIPQPFELLPPSVTVNYLVKL